MPIWYCDECAYEYQKKPIQCVKCGSNEFTEYLTWDDKTKLTMKISDIHYLVLNIADGTKLGDSLTQIIVDATPENVKEFIIEETKGGKI